MKFTLEIKLGNDAMQDPYDVAETLRRLADQMSDQDYPYTGRVRDLNGNTVGTYRFK